MCKIWLHSDSKSWERHGKQCDIATEALLCIVATLCLEQSEYDT